MDNPENRQKAKTFNQGRPDRFFGNNKHTKQNQLVIFVVSKILPFKMFFVQVHLIYPKVIFLCPDEQDCPYFVRDCPYFRPRRENVIASCPPCTRNRLTPYNRDDSCFHGPNMACP